MRYRTRDTEEESDRYRAYGMWYQVLGGSTCSPRGILPIQKKGKESKESDRYRDYGTWYQVPEGSTYSPCGISPIKKIERDESIKVSCSNKIPYSYPLKKKWHTPLATTWGGQFWLNLNLNSSCIPSTTKQNHILAAVSLHHKVQAGADAPCHLPLGICLLEMPNHTIFRSCVN